MLVQECWLQGYQTLCWCSIWCSAVCLPFDTFRWPTRKAFVLRTDAAFAAPGLPNLCWCRNAGSKATKRYAGAAFGARRFAYLLVHFGGLLEKHLFLGRTLLLRLQGYQTCGDAGMLASGLANAVVAQHFVLGCFPHLLVHFGGLLKKLLFLGRTLLLQLQGYQTCGGAGIMAPGLANAVLMQHLVLGCFPHLLGDFGSLRTKVLFLGRTLLLRLQGYQTCDAEEWWLQG